MKHLESNRLVAEMVDQQIEALSTLKASGVQPHMRIFRDEEGAQNQEIRSYTRSLVEHARRLGELANMQVTDLVSVKTVSARDMVPMTRDINGDPKVSGVLHMSPMPEFDEVVGALEPALDIDRMHPYWSKEGWHRDSETGLVITGNIPITAEATQRLLEYHGKIGRGVVATQFGRGRTVGGPLAASLESMGVNLQFVGRNTSDEERRAMLNKSTVVIGAVGSPIIKAEELHDGQAVAGVGLRDIYPEVYASNLDIRVTPQHLHEDKGVGLVTSAGAWERTIRNAADLADIEVAMGGLALATL